MEKTPTPPILPTTIPNKACSKKFVWAASLLWSLVIFGIPIVIICKFVSGSILHISIPNKSNDDRFSVKFLEVKSQPNLFEERVRVQCQNDMDLGLWVTDLNKAGFLEMKATNGNVYYQEGHPRGIGANGLIRAEGQFSQCEFFIRLNTSSDHTAWHLEISKPNEIPLRQTLTTEDTSLTEALTISGFETNWPGTYPRGSDIPLANMGSKKIMLSIQ